MDSAQIIRASVADVSHLRQLVACDAQLASAVSAVKTYQALRFQNSYRDLISGGPYQAATRFFLDELYGDADYSSRDAQFARIAGAIQRMMPTQAVATAVALARLHAQTEQLDFQMGNAWQSVLAWVNDAERYVLAWRAVGQQEQRLQQLKLVLTIGQDLVTLTRTPGLRILLRMMRRPAVSAGLPDLQHFLESGFDTFAAMGAHKSRGPIRFLALIDTRESEFIHALFDVTFDSSKAVENQVLPAGCDRP